MDERRLFERYMQGRLGEADKERLAKLLAGEEAARRFTEFAGAWSIMAEVSVELAETRLRGRSRPLRPGVSPNAEIPS